MDFLKLSQQKSEYFTLILFCVPATIVIVPLEESLCVSQIAFFNSFSKSGFNAFTDSLVTSIINCFDQSFDLVVISCVLTLIFMVTIFKTISQAEGLQGSFLCYPPSLTAIRGAGEILTPSMFRDTYPMPMQCDEKVSAKRVRNFLALLRLRLLRSTDKAMCPLRKI